MMQKCLNLVNDMKRLILLISFVLFLSCVREVKTNRMTTFAYKPEMYAYRIRFMKLPSGSIPADSYKMPLSDSTTITLKWLQNFATEPIEEQYDPRMYGFTSDTTTVFLLDQDVTYITPDSIASYVRADSMYISLSEGEYQVQVQSSIWSTAYQRPLWSKYSNAYPFYALVPSDPPVQATNVILEIR